ncbi:MAG: DNA strand exchange inhibitor protein [Planctomycetia bacterium]|nr:DNA strand exchange inhibitor protein [Planctomycetia bacterium]
MDAHTLELLDFAKIRDLIAAYSACSLGKELARGLSPFGDIGKARTEIALVTEMVDALTQGLAPPFAGLHDIRMSVKRAAIGVQLTAEQLLEIADTLTCTGHAYRYRMRLSSRHGRLIELLTPVEDMGPIARSIAGCIDGRGHVLDMASRELAQVRQKLAEVDERVQQVIQRLLRDPAIRAVLRYPNATVSGDHYVLPVAVNHRHKIPGVVHRTSSTGETVFVEPAGVASLSAERVVLKGEEDREIRRILRRLSGDVGKVSRPLANAVEILARLDLITSKARYARDYDHFPPDLNTEGRLWLRQARHPILESLFREQNEAGVGEKRAVVPIDVRLGHGFNILVITGPNTGGKTVCLKTAGLLSLMAMAGLHIPAGEGSSVPMWRDVLADIGDEQSLEQSLSTFSSHITRIGHILRSTDENCLVLLDEMGAGTDPTEGAALGRAILDKLDELRCRAMVTTHLGDLKTYAFNNDRAENGAVQFSIETLRPTYVLEIGRFGMSNALRIAKRLKLPKDLLARAHRYLTRKQKRAPEMVQLQKMREEAEKARSEALAAQHQAEREAEELRRKQDELARAAAEAAALKDARSRLVPGDTVDVPKFGKPGKVVRTDFRKNVVVVSVGIGQWEVGLEEVFPVA